VDDDGGLMMDGFLCVFRNAKDYCYDGETRRGMRG